MKNKLFFYNISLLVIGIVLILLACLEMVDEFWSGTGSALAVVSSIRILRTYRLNKSQAYREKMEVETTDERLQYIRLKAWGWAGYLFILIAAVSVIIFKVAGLELLSLAASCAVCLVLALFWISYLILRKKY